MTIHESAMLRRKPGTTVRFSCRVSTSRQEIRGNAHTERLPSLTMPIDLRIDRMVKESHSSMFFMNVSTRVQEISKRLQIIHLDSDMCRAHHVFHGIILAIQRAVRGHCLHWSPASLHWGTPSGTDRLPRYMNHIPESPSAAIRTPSQNQTKDRSDSLDS